MRDDPPTLRSWPDSIFSPHETLDFYLPRIVLDEFTDEAGARRVADFSCQPEIIDPVVAQLGATLLPAFERPEEVSSLFVDHVTLALLTHLCGRYGGASADIPYRKGGMTQLQLRRAKEFLVSHCGAERPAGRRGPGMRVVAQPLHEIFPGSRGNHSPSVAAALSGG